MGGAVAREASPVLGTNVSQDVLLTCCSGRIPDCSSCPGLDVGHYGPDEVSILLPTSGELTASVSENSGCPSAGVSVRGQSGLIAHSKCCWLSFHISTQPCMRAFLAPTFGCMRESSDDVKRGQLAR